MGSGQLTPSGGRLRPAGFTLIEIMTVLVILGVVVSVAVIRAPAENRQLLTEASRVAAALELLSQQAVVRGVPHALELAGPNYFMREFRHGEWADSQLPGIASRHAIPSPLRLDLVADAAPAGAPGRIVMFPSGEFSVTEFRVTDPGTGDAVSYSVNAYGRFERAQ